MTALTREISGKKPPVYIGIAKQDERFVWKIMDDIWPELTSIFAVRDAMALKL